jgi:5-methylcytosine-specific restriction protein A
MAWSTSNRAGRLPPDWPLITKRILVRDHHQCQIGDADCGGWATEVDHIEPGDDHRPVNLRAACTTCHAHKSAREGVAARARLRQLRYRRPENHPGRRLRP